jgi:hypothetical protein
MQVLGGEEKLGYLNLKCSIDNFDQFFRRDTKLSQYDRAMLVCARSPGSCIEFERVKATRLELKLRVR